MCGIFTHAVHKRINYVIKKGRGNGPVEALATLYPLVQGIKKVLRSTNYSKK